MSSLATVLSDLRRVRDFCVELWAIEQNVEWNCVQYPLVYLHAVGMYSCMQ